jgi:hypothetical protein
VDTRLHTLHPQRFGEAFASDSASLVEALDTTHAWNLDHAM